VTAQGAILGTLQYMAPEQLEGREADPRTDIFALGCVLYEMLTGKRAFDGKTQASLIAAILEREPAPLITLQPSTPRALDRPRCVAGVLRQLHEAVAQARHAAGQCHCRLGTRAIRPRAIGATRCAIQSRRHAAGSRSTVREWRCAGGTCRATQDRRCAGVERERVREFQRGTVRCEIHRAPRRRHAPAYAPLHAHTRAGGTGCAGNSTSHCARPGEHAAGQGGARDRLTTLRRGGALHAP